MKELYRDMVAQAASSGAGVVCLPEFSLSPYFPSTRHRSGFQWAEPLLRGDSDTFFGGLARQNQVTIVASIFERAEGDRYFDTATIHGSDGRLRYHTRKVHIPSGEGYHETEFFEGGIEYPVHDIGRIKIGVPTCYDQWFPEVARIYAMNGAELIFYPTAIGSEPEDQTFDSKEAWQTVMRGHAAANGLFVAAANRTGRENDLQFYGSSFICDPTGRVLAQAGRDTTEVIHAELDGARLTRYRDLFQLLSRRRPETYSRILEKVDDPP
jgi:N-carbamoylputrescine amidase